MVEMQLTYQPEGYRRLYLEGQAARTARENVGGKWPVGQPLTVRFDKAGGVDVRK